MSTPEIEAAPVIDDDPALLQALLESYIERTAELSAEHSRVKLGQTPPASAETIKCLPLIELREEDLADPVNRECCVCLDDNNVGDKAVRMPHCSHLFHKDCIVDWLERKCTCPVCRCEHATDNPDFEEERLERLHLQKPRYARHELDRMTYNKLLTLLAQDDNNNSNDQDDNNNNNSDGQSDQQLTKADIVDRLIQAGIVETYNAPEPVVGYKLSALQKMSVPQLRRCMKDAGVFTLNPKDALKKDEMIQVFLHSGRLHILPEASLTEMGSSSWAETQQQHSNKSCRRVEAGSNKGLRKKIRRLFLTCKF